MKITIAGAGRVGLHLAKYFTEEQQDVFLVDDDENTLSFAESDLNLRTVVGDPTDLNTLREAATERADIDKADVDKLQNLETREGVVGALHLPLPERRSRADEIVFPQHRRPEILPVAVENLNVAVVHRVRHLEAPSAESHPGIIIRDKHPAAHHIAVESGRPSGLQPRRGRSLHRHS